METKLGGNYCPISVIWASPPVCKREVCQTGLLSLQKALSFSFCLVHSWDSKRYEKEGTFYAVTILHLQFEIVFIFLPSPSSSGQLLAVL